MLTRNYIKYALYCVLTIWFSLAKAGAYEDFFDAILQDDGKKVSAFIQRGFDANALNPRGQNGLFIAMQLGHFKAALALLEDPGLRVDQPNSMGETPLMMAALKGHLEWCQRLVHLGSSVRRDGWTPLHYAASAGTEQQAAVIRFLLLSNAEVDAVAPNGTTPLMLASMYGSEDAIRSLLVAGADPARRNQREMRPGDFARLAGRDRLALALDRLAGQAARADR